MTRPLIIFRSSTLSKRTIVPVVEHIPLGPTREFSFHDAMKNELVKINTQKGNDHVASCRYNESDNAEWS